MASFRPPLAPSAFGAAVRALLLAAASSHPRARSSTRCAGFGALPKVKFRSWGKQDLGGIHISSHKWSSRFPQPFQIGRSWGVFAGAP